jgi:shikimate dehydrogenase
VGRLVLLGHPVAHSLSPRFQNAALRAAGVAARYDAQDVAPGDLDATLAALAADRAAGNITVPHKEAVAARCDVRSALAERVGAVNTFWHDAAGHLVGDNTDVGGFDAAVRAVLPDPSGARVALVGAGGSASAVLAAVAGWPRASVRAWSRRPHRAAALARREPGIAEPVERLTDALAGASLVVNATPLGLRDDDPFPAEVNELPAAATVFDLVYRAGCTRWVRAARAAGHPADDGLSMLIEQGALAFERWFGRAPSREAMWASIADVAGARRGAG